MKFFNVRAIAYRPITYVRVRINLLICIAYVRLLESAKTVDDFQEDIDDDADEVNNNNGVEESDLDKDETASQQGSNQRSGNQINEKT